MATAVDRNGGLAQAIAAKADHHTLLPVPDLAGQRTGILDTAAAAAGTAAVEMGAQRRKRRACQNVAGEISDHGTKPGGPPMAFHQRAKSFRIDDPGNDHVFDSKCRQAPHPSGAMPGLAFKSPEPGIFPASGAFGLLPQRPKGPQQLKTKPAGSGI